MDSSRLTNLWSMIRPVADLLLADRTGVLEPSNRWRLFAVAASGTSMNGQREVDLYVARLRKRRASPAIYANGSKSWFRKNTDVKVRRTLASTRR